MSTPELPVIDAQINLGQSPNGPNSDLSIYELEAERLGIKAAIAMSTPAHIIQTDEGEETACLWQLTNDDSQRYRKEVRRGGGEPEITYNPERPFYEANRQVHEIVRTHNEQRTSLKLFFAPKLHPVLDDADCVDDFIDEDTACLKIHGITTHSHPDMFPQWIADVAHHHDLPILVHTDYYDGPLDESIEPWTRRHYELYQQNNPMAFIKWAQRNKLKVAINHGASLHLDSIKAVNDDENLVLVYGPDSLIELDSERLATPTDDYARTLFEHANPEKVLFSTDFAWNVNDRGEWKDFRWDSIDRVRSILDEDDQNKVLHDNIMDFYQLKL